MKARRAPPGVVGESSLPRPRYTRTAIVLHGVMALLIVTGFCLGLSMADLPLSPLKLRLFSYHKWVGVSVWALLLVRVLWRIMHAPPPLPAGMPAWERTAAHAGHLLLYVLMALIPISGWLMSSAQGVTTVYLGLWPLPDLLAKNEALGRLLLIVHRILNYALLGAVVLHVAAALKHHFVDRDGVLGRMFRLTGATE
ncbi:cytochrome b [Polaromonas sp. C04]|uniref:cytochrome b n=1 Tax=Polaromonas sp. C04 TaxID=1945857 RepID=UPI00098550CF|nr:cytochrome b [Polaromonas sp. C04]OOG55326.1 cytochrome b [Polaromonas sp. C04]